MELSGGHTVQMPRGLPVHLEQLRRLQNKLPQEDEIDLLQKHLESEGEKTSVPKIGREGDGALSPQIAGKYRCSERTFFSHLGKKGGIREMVDDFGQDSRDMADIRGAPRLPGFLSTCKMES